MFWMCRACYTWGRHVHHFKDSWGLPKTGRFYLAESERCGRRLLNDFNIDPDADEAKLVNKDFNLQPSTRILINGCLTLRRECEDKVKRGGWRLGSEACTKCMNDCGVALVEEAGAIAPLAFIPVLAPFVAPLEAVFAAGNLAVGAYCAVQSFVA